MAATSAKPALPALKTPMSATYPSELRSPPLATPGLIKREDGGLKTPISPPAAYVDFLKALSPALMSPLATGTSSRFSFDERPPPSRTTSAESAATIASTSAASDALEKAESPATSRASSRSNSCSNADSSKAPAADSSKAPAAAAVSAAAADVRVTIPPPPEPFTRPLSARTPRLRIPPSPFSAGSVRSPMSAHSLQSPYSATVMSPGGWALDGGKSRDSTGRAVSVRQVVTRTVTYSRTPVEATDVAPLDPAPKGKRRRIK